jgi:hypothetical protein
MPLTESMAEFYDQADFATSAQFTPAGGGSAVSVLGIFDADYVEPFSAVEGKQIAFRVFVSQFASRPTKGSALIINATTYRVKNVQDVPPNGAELRLMLEAG